MAKRSVPERPSRARVCANCALVLDRPRERCPRCGALVAHGREDNLADKTSADSFPASDPPSSY